MTSSEDSDNKLSDFKEKSKKEGEKLVLEEFPQRILELEKLLTEEKFDESKMSICHQEINIPVPEVKVSDEKKEEGAEKKSGEAVSGLASGEAKDRAGGSDELEKKEESTDLTQKGGSVEEVPQEVSRAKEEPETGEKREQSEAKEGRTAPGTGVGGKLEQKSGTADDKPKSFSRKGLDRRVFLYPRGVSSVNSLISEMINVVKPMMTRFDKDMKQLKLAIVLLVPKVEDGNNFGVEVQENVISAIGQAEGMMLMQYNQMSDYFVKRGELISLVARFPHCQDYRRAVVELDEKFRLVLCTTIFEIRGRYLRLHDLIIKNLDKIKNPRSRRDDDMSLY